MDNSPLSRLPAELRQEIYHHTFQVDGDLSLLRVSNAAAEGSDEGRMQWVVRAVYSPPLGCKTKSPPDLMPALLRTCRQVHAEALPIFYAANDWEVPLF